MEKQRKLIGALGLAVMAAALALIAACENPVRGYVWGKTAYTVTFNLGGEAGTPPAALKAAKGEPITLPGHGVSRSDFAGWYEENGPFAGWPGEDYFPASNITLYARWGSGASTTALTFDVNGGDGLPEGYSGKTAVYDNPMPSLAGASIPARAGYTFTGWFDGKEESAVMAWILSGALVRNRAPSVHASTTAEGLTQYYNDKNESIHLWDKETAEATLYAGWIVRTTYTVTLDKAGGTGGDDTVQATFGAEMPSIAVPSRAGYAFDGYFDQNGTQYYNAAGTSANIWDKQYGATLYARWTENGQPQVYHIILDKQGGSGGTDSVDAALGSLMPGISVPSREGYAFQGYWTSPGGMGTKYYSADGTSAHDWDLSKDTILYAYWLNVSDGWTITFDPNYEGASPWTETVAKGGTITLPGLSREGFTLGGWWTDSAGGVLAGAAGASYQPASSLTLYARWLVAPGVTIDLSNVSAGGAGYTYSGGVITVQDGGSVRVTGTSAGGRRIAVAPGASAGILLEEAYIYFVQSANPGATVWGVSPLDLGAGSNLTLALKGYNQVDAAGTIAAIHVPPTASLTITSADGDGSAAGKIDATQGSPNHASGGEGAAIGGNNTESAGTITIRGGTVYAEAWGIGAGIGGGGHGGTGGVIRVSGGTVTGRSWGDFYIKQGGGATTGGGHGGAGIGGGNGGSGGNITISGGTVTGICEDSMYAGAGIGGGFYGGGGVITITGGYVTGGVGANNGRDLWSIRANMDYYEYYPYDYYYPSSAGIGGGYGGGGGDITISGGHGYAFSRNYEKLVGPGLEGSGGTFNGAEGAWPQGAETKESDGNYRYDWMW